MTRDRRSPSGTCAVGSGPSGAGASAGTSTRGRSGGRVASSERRGAGPPAPRGAAAGRGVRKRGPGRAGHDGPRRAPRRWLSWVNPERRGTLAGIATKGSPLRTSSAKAERLPRGPHSTKSRTPSSCRFRINSEKRTGSAQCAMASSRIASGPSGTAGRSWHRNRPLATPETEGSEQLANRLDHGRELGRVVAPVERQAFEDDPAPLELRPRRWPSFREGRPAPTGGDSCPLPRRRARRPQRRSTRRGFRGRRRRRAAYKWPGTTLPLAASLPSSREPKGA